MSKFNAKIFVSVFFVMITQSAIAGSDMGMGQGRLFFGAAKADPKDVNTELTAQGIKNIDTSNQYGIEITFPIFQYLQLGLRYSHHYISEGEVTSTANDYRAEITQDGMLGMARVPFLKTDIVHADVFAGVGANSSTYSEKAAGQDGKLSNSANPYYLAGASLALGFKQYFVFFEGGFESNKVGSLKSSGTINNGISSIDLSGSYFMVGLMFDGIPIFKK
jgi:hypothetical protein